MITDDKQPSPLSPISPAADQDKASRMQPFEAEREATRALGGSTIAEEKEGEAERQEDVEKGTAPSKSRRKW